VILTGIPAAQRLSWMVVDTSPRRPIPLVVYLQQTLCGLSVRGWLAVAPFEFGDRSGAAVLGLGCCRAAVEPRLYLRALGTPL
jgi:hypothetical protein